MAGCACLIAACILLLLEVYLTSGQYEEGCPYNEVDVDCVTGCNTCEFINTTCRIMDECEPGCDCKDGFLRNKFGYCIPRKYCGASNEEPPTEGGREVANSGGCPDAQTCIFSCKRRGFGTGLCLGTRLEFCNCYTAPVSAEQGPPGNREVANSGGCPNIQICNLSCKRRGFATGLCLGAGLGFCNCYTSSLAPADGNREVANSGGCPNTRNCIRSCKRRNFETGVCLGPRRGYCNCYTSSLAPADGNREVADSGGCPNTRNCIRSCRRRNFETGVCQGPRRGYCNCYSSSNSRNHGCPQRSLCEAHCKRRKFSTGICTGDRRLDCECSGKLD